MKKIVKIIALILSVAFVLGACGTATSTTLQNEKNNNVSTEKTSDEAAASDDSVTASKGNLVKFTMENGGEFIIELYPQYAPETVQNFKNLVATGFYDGLTFHRVVEGFMAQGGDPEGTGAGGSEKTIKGEFRNNDFLANTLSHTRGVVSMARRGDPQKMYTGFESSEYMDSASSQFFICYDDVPSLDGDYAAFGKVIEGMEVVDSFLEVERVYSGRELSKPVEPIVIESAVIVE